MKYQRSFNLGIGAIPNKKTIEFIKFHSLCKAISPQHGFSYQTCVRMKESTAVEHNNI